MKVKNVSTRLQHVGDVSIAPLETKEIPDSFRNAINKKALVEIKAPSKAAVTAAEAKVTSAKAALTAAEASKKDDAIAEAKDNLEAAEAELQELVGE